MRFRIRLEEADQTIIVLLEGDYVGLQFFCGDPHHEDAEQPYVWLLGAEGLERLLSALFQARIALERVSVAECFHVMTNGFGYEAL